MFFSFNTKGQECYYEELGQIFQENTSGSRLNCDDVGGLSTVYTIPVAFYV